MAADTIHDVTRRFESGGTVTITGFGADTLTIPGVVPGSLNFTPPARNVLPYTDRGVQQVPLDGDDELGKVSFDVRGSKETTNHLMTLVTAAPSGATATEGTITIKFPDGRGASTGLVYAFAGVSRGELPSYKAGTDFDVMSFSFMCRSWTAPTTY